MGSDDDVTFGGVQVLAAAGGNGKGNAGANGNGNGASNGNGANGNGANAAAAATQHGDPQNETKLAHDDPLHPHNLGRLNSFFNASSSALQNASEGSALGLISQVYAGQLSAYIGASAAVAANVDPLALTQLEAAAAADLEAAAMTLATVANKPLSPEIVAAVHERLASENPGDPALAGLANPTPDQLSLTPDAAAAVAAANATLLANILAAASSVDSQITDNGLGPIY
jgi:hypothetical protein